MIVVFCVSISLLFTTFNVLGALERGENGYLPEAGDGAVGPGGDRPGEEKGPPLREQGDHRMGQGPPRNEMVPTPLGEELTRVGVRGGVTESNEGGGSWWDTFDDETSIHSKAQVELSDGIYSIGDYVYHDGFEGNSVNMSYWTEAGGGTRYVTGAKAHTGSQCLQIVDIPPSENRNGLYHQWGKTHQGSVSLWVFDNLGNTSLAFKVRTSSQNAVGILQRESSPGNYFLEDDGDFINTWIGRSVGWHKFEWRVGSSGTIPYIDGNQVTAFTGEATDFNYIRFANAWIHDQISWVDDFEARWPYWYGSVNSTEVSLPAGEVWDTLHVGCEIPSQSSALLTILDGATRQPITGYSNLDLSASPEIDISAITADSIAWNLDLDRTTIESPEISYWGISSNASTAWRDTLFGGTKLEGVPASFRAVDGELKKISGFGNDEVVRTAPIVMPQGFEPETLRVTKVDYPSAKLYVTVLDGSSDEPIPGFEDLEAAEVDLSDIDPLSHPTLKLEARFDATPTYQPALKDWSVEWKLITAPKIDELPTVEVLEDTLEDHSLDLALYTTSAIDDSRELVYELSGISADWADVYIEDGHYIAVDATVTPNSNSGIYGPITAEVTATDSEGDRSLPADLTVYIVPMNDEPYPDEDIPDITIYEGGWDKSIYLNSRMYFRDAEFENIFYGVEVDPLHEISGEEGSLTASLDPVSSNLVIQALGDFNTEGGPPVPVWVYADDDTIVNTVAAGYLADGVTPDWVHQEIDVTVINVNDPPVWDPVPSIEMDEDGVEEDALYLVDYVTDVDNDVFDIRFELLENTYDRIDVSITDDGWVSVEPESNVWGEAQVQVEVTDGMDAVTTTFSVVVGPVNDPPEVDIGSPEPDEAVRGPVDISGTAFDVENTLEYVELLLAPTTYLGPSGGTRFVSEPSTIRAQGLGDWQYRWDTLPLANGEWRITARAYDGSAFSLNTSVIVIVDNPRNQPPTTWIVSHSSGAEVPPEMVELTGTSSDPDGSVELVQISLEGNTTWSPCQPDADSGTFEKWSYSLDASKYAGRTLTVFVRAFDGSLYSDETAITLIVGTGGGGGGGHSGAEENDPGGRNISVQGIILIVIAVIISTVILLVVLLISKKKGGAGQDGDETPSAPALQPDVVTHGSRPTRLRATPAAGGGPATAAIGLPAGGVGPSATLDVVAGPSGGASQGPAPQGASPPQGGPHPQGGPAHTSSAAPPGGGAPGAVASHASTLGGAQPATPETLLPPAMAVPVGQDQKI